MRLRFVRSIFGKLLEFSLKLKEICLFLLSRLAMLKLVDLVWMEHVEVIAVDLLEFSLVHVVLEAKDGHGFDVCVCVVASMLLKAGGYIS